jgi:hypothetical protein
VGQGYEVSQLTVLAYKQKISFEILLQAFVRIRPKIKKKKKERKALLNYTTTAALTSSFSMGSLRTAM